MTYAQGEHTDALGKYAMALSYINDDFIVQLHGPHAAKAAAVKQPVHLNMAACQLKLKDWQGAEWNCSQVCLAVRASHLMHLPSNMNKCMCSQMRLNTTLRGC